MAFDRALNGCVVLLSFFAMLALSNGVAAQPQEGRRIALVIGNGAYRNVDRLSNPDNDARLMASTLQAAGFFLVGGGPQLDLDKPRFDRLVQQFGKTLPGADVALFYYSGHGMQVSGENWLVPIDANPTTPKDLDFQMVDANLVLHQMEDSGTKLNLVILDACRNNPFAIRGIRSSGGGLAEMHAPEGTLISYATQPGNVATDGASADSPYTQALVDAIRRPGLDVFHVFNQVGLTVKQTTGGAQQPWLASSPIAGNFYFFNNGPVTISIPSPAPAAPPAAALSAPSEARFDGAWKVELSCQTSSDGALGYRYEFVARVANGVLHGDRGAPGAPGSSGYFALDGSIQPDGSALLVAHGLTGDPGHTVGHVPERSPFFYHYNAHFAGTSGTASRVETRPCNLAFSKL
jgi:hypothetical protein